MAITVAQCETMIEACHQAGVTLMVVQSQRFRGGEPHAYQTLIAGQIGAVRQIRHWSQQPLQFAQNLAKTHPFTIDPAGSGILMGWSVHSFDLVRWLADGTEETVRFIGVDTPEAGRFTKSQLTPGTQAQLELDAEPRDRYGRLLAYVWLNGEMFNRRLVAEGYAQPLRIASNVRYAAEFEALAGEARVKGRGLWGMCGVK